MMTPPKHQQGQGIVETVASNNTEFVNLTDAAERDDTDQTPALLSHPDAMREEIHCSKRMWRKNFHRHRKIRRCGWAKATAMSVLLLSTFSSSVICSEINDTDHSTLLSRASPSGMLQNLFGSFDGEQEAHQQQLDDEPPTRKGMLRRTVKREDEEQQHRILRQEEEISTREHLARKNRRIRIEENNLAKERLARQRQARIARGRRMRQDQILPGDGAMLPQTNEELAIETAAVAGGRRRRRSASSFSKNGKTLHFCLLVIS